MGRGQRNASEATGALAGLRPRRAASAPSWVKDTAALELVRAGDFDTAARLVREGDPAARETVLRAIGEAVGKTTVGRAYRIVCEAAGRPSEDFAQRVADMMASDDLERDITGEDFEWHAARMGAYAVDDRARELAGHPRRSLERAVGGDLAAALATEKGEAHITEIYGADWRWTAAAGRLDEMLDQGMSAQDAWTNALGLHIFARVTAHERACS